MRQRETISPLPRVTVPHASQRREIDPTNPANATPLSRRIRPSRRNKPAGIRHGPRRRSGTPRWERSLPVRSRFPGRGFRRSRRGCMTDHPSPEATPRGICPLPGIFHRERTEQDRVDDCEDRRVRSDAEREREHRHSGVLEQRAQGEFEEIHGSLNALTGC